MQVDQELIQYDFGSGFHGFWRYMVICGWPYPSHGADAHSVFQVSTSRLDAYVCIGGGVGWGVGMALPLTW